MRRGSAPALVAGLRPAWRPELRRALHTNRKDRAIYAAADPADGALSVLRLIAYPPIDEQTTITPE